MRRRCVREALTFNLGGIALGLVSLCGAALALALFDYVQSASSFGYAPRGVIENVIAAPKTFLHIAYLGAVAFIAGLGVILVVVYLLRTPSSIATFIHAYTTSDLSERAAATAYVALAERILKVRYRKENRQSHEFESCEFPIQKSIENLSEVERSKAMKHNGVVKKRARSILPQVAPTRAALVSMLPGEIQQALSASQAVGRG